jgi:hypothetical protein
MAKKQKSKTLAPFTLKMKLTEVPTDQFLKSVQAFYQFLQELTKEVAGPDEKIIWKTSVNRGSAEISFNPYSMTPLPSTKRKLYKVSDEIFEAIETDKEPPKEFTPQMARHLHAVIEVTKPTKDDEKGLGMMLLRPKREYELTPELLKPLNKAMHVVEYYGFIEGELQGITSRKGLKLTIYERIQGRPISCYVRQDRIELFEKAMQLFNRRVQVYGMMKSKKDGTPLSIDLEDIKPLPQENQIPDLNQLRGIFKNYG